MSLDFSSLPDAKQESSSSGSLDFSSLPDAKPSGTESAASESDTPVKDFFKEGFLGRIGTGLGERAAHAMLPENEKKLMEGQDQLSIMAEQAKKAAADPKGTTSQIGSNLKEAGKQAVEHPVDALIGLGKSIVQDPEFLLIGGMGATARVAKMTDGLNKVVQAGAKTLATAGEGAATMAGMETAAQTAERKPYDPVAIGTQAGFGAAFGAGVSGVKYIAQAATRNIHTGKVTTMGDKHDPEMKTHTDEEQGFVNSDGEFLKRMEALEAAKKAGQVPPDGPTLHEGEGLHTTDLKGESTKVEPPKTREEHKVRIGELDSAIEESKKPDWKGANSFKMIEERNALLEAMPKPEVKNKEHLTLEEGKDVLYGVKTVGEALSRLSEGGYGTKGQQLLLGLLQRSGIAKDKSFRFVDHQLKDPDNPDKLWAGMYDPTGNTGVIMSGKQDVEQPPRIIRDVLHEAVHAASHGILSDPNSTHSIRMQALYDYVEANSTPEQLKMYGMTDIHEFLSEAGTNDRFQAHLQNMPMPETWQRGGGKGNAWDSFKNVIKNYLTEKFGREFPKEAHTAFDEAMDIGSHIVETPKEQAEAKGLFGRKDVMTVEEERAFRDKQEQERKLPAEMEADPEIKKEMTSIDPRSIANEEEFMKAAGEIFTTQGKEASLQFFRAWKEHQSNAAIPVPKDVKDLADALYKVNTWSSADSSAFRSRYEENTYGRKLTFMERMRPTKEMKAQKKAMDDLREKWFRSREKEPGVTLTPEEQARMDKVLADGDKEIVALIQKARKLTNDPRALRELETGQSRYRIFSKKERTIADFLDTKNPLNDNVAEEASATRERSVFQLEGGRVIQIDRDPKTDTDFVKEWKDGKPSVWKDKSGKMVGPGYIARGERGKRLTAGDTIKVDGKDIKITDGQVHNLERHTPFRYMKDAEGSQAMKIMELRKMTRDLELLDGLKKTNFMGTGKPPETPQYEVPRGYRTPTSIDKIPQLKGWMFDPKTAAIIEDFAKVWDSSLYMRFTGQLIKNMMLNPFPHMMNEAAHLWNLRGLSGWATPKGMVSFARTGKQAFMDVATQSEFYRQIMKEGGATLGAEPRNSEHWNQIGTDAIERMQKDPEIQEGLKQLAKKMGLGTMDFYNAWSKNSQKSMWFVRDTMYVQAVRETVAMNTKRGTPIDLKEAIRRVEEHMPNYRMPSEILNSRMLSKALQNPNIAIFSRYHYGVAKSLINIGKDLVKPGDLRTPEARQNFKNGLDSLLAAGVAMTVGYALLDALAEKVFGDGAHVRRAGPFHILDAVGKVATGDRDLSAVAYTVFTFNPVLLTLSQLILNKNLFTGKQIYHPEDDAGQIGSDVGRYAIKAVPQLSTGLQAQDQGDMTGAVAKQFDVQYKTEKQQKMIDREKKYRERQKKARDTKRNRGEYNP